MRLGHLGIRLATRARRTASKLAGGVQPHLYDAALVVGGEHAVGCQVQPQAGRCQRVSQQRHHLPAPRSLIFLNICHCLLLPENTSSSVCSVMHTEISAYKHARGKQHAGVQHISTDASEAATQRSSLAQLASTCVIQSFCVSHLQSQHVLPAVIADLEDERLRPWRLLLATPPALIHLAADGDCISHACTGNGDVVEVMHVHKDSQVAGCCLCHGKATCRSRLCLIGPHLPADVHAGGTSGNEHGTCW